MQTNNTSAAYKAVSMYAGQFVHADKNITGQILKIECGHVTVLWADGSRTDEQVDKVVATRPPYRIYSRQSGWVCDCGTVLDYAVKVFHQYKTIIGDVELMEYNGNEWQEVR